MQIIRLTLQSQQHEVHGDTENSDEKITDGTMDAQPQAAVAFGAQTRMQAGRDRPFNSTLSVQASG
jgi:hypothetical protein